MKAKFTNTKLKQVLSSWIALSTLLFFSTIAFADYQYDGSGNIVQDDQFHYSYNDANRLSAVRERSSSGKIVAQYFYNHEGRRIKKIENGKTCYYINRSFQSCDDGDTIYYFLENERIAHKISNVKTYYHNNHLGSPVALTNQQKSTIERISYEPYGQTASKSQYTYTGKEKDSTGDYYFEARYYDPVLKQFKQTDPVSPVIGDSYSLNPYTYTRNNPLKYVDPDGKRYKFPSEIVTAYNRFFDGINNRRNQARGQFFESAKETAIITADNSPRSNITRNRINQHTEFIDKTASSQNVDPRIVKAIIFEEQNHKIPIAESAIAERYIERNQTVGLGQITVDDHGKSRAQLLNAETNIVTIVEIIAKIKQEHNLTNEQVSTIGEKYNYNKPGTPPESSIQYGERVQKYHDNF